MHQNYIKYNAETLSKYHQSFTGKERDSETGFSYFGARYYDSDILTGWLSVDPMADKYPNISPYAYCAWNPVRLVDPDGKEIDKGTLTDEIKNMINENHKNYNKAFHDIYNNLDSDPNTIYRFCLGEGIDKGGSTTYGGTDERGKDIININYTKGGGIKRAKEGCLLEETYHAYQFMNGKFGYKIENGKFVGCVSLDLNDEFEAKVWVAENIPSKPGKPKIGYYKDIEKLKNAKIECFRSFLKNCPTVDFTEYETLKNNPLNMYDCQNISFDSKGRAYSLESGVRIVGRKPVK